MILPVAWVIWMKPSSRAASTSARQRMSSSHIVSVTIGVPSKSACVELRPRRWIEKPHNPASIPSSRTRCISLRSASVAGRLFAASRPITYVISDAVGMYWMQFTPFGAPSSESRYSGIVSQSQCGSMPLTIDSYGIASVRVIVSIERSRKSGRTGAKPKPQLPSTTEVTPCQPEIVHHGSQRIWAS